MKNSTLLLRTLLVVATIAGVPHALAIYVGSNSQNGVEAPSIVYEEVEGWESYWVGKYEVSFDGAPEKAHYEIRKESGVFKCYSTLLIDEKGNRFKDNTLVMGEVKISDSKATAEYQIEYEGEKFKVDCKMEMDDDGNVALRYDYYGYKGKENWKRLEQ